jgi:hypothetical protein
LKILRVLGNSQTALLQIVQALGTTRFFAGACQCGQEHSSQNGDDRDDDEQLNERKATELFLEEQLGTSAPAS